MHIQRRKGRCERREKAGVPSGLARAGRHDLLVDDPIDAASALGNLDAVAEQHRSAGEAVHGKECHGTLGPQAG